MIICLACLLCVTGRLPYLESLLPVIALYGPSIVLVLIQPDLGTSLVFAAITFGMLYVSGFSMKIVKQIMAVLLFRCRPYGSFFFMTIRKCESAYHDPNVDPYGSGYHVIQSKIAIGSGGFFGKDLFAGTQSQLNFLPENHTDFIFSVVGEELGFVGAMFLLFLFFIVLYRTLLIARNTTDRFGSLMAVGIMSMAVPGTYQCRHDAGIIPVTGIPFPFMSYGGSAIVL